MNSQAGPRFFWVLLGKKKISFIASNFKIDLGWWLKYPVPIESKYKMLININNNVTFSILKGTLLPLLQLRPLTKKNPPERGYISGLGFYSFSMFLILLLSTLGFERREEEEIRRAGKFLLARYPGGDLVSEFSKAWPMVKADWFGRRGTGGCNC